MADTMKLKNNKDMKTKVIAKIIKGGFNVNDANNMVNEFWPLAERYGCVTVKEFANTITGLWAA